MKALLISIMILTGITLLGQARDEGNILTLRVNELSSVEGKLGIRLFNADEEVIDEQWVDVDGEEMTAYFRIPEVGKYAVQYFHDENNNGELDFKWYGPPVEGTGNSNNVRGVFGPPNFEKQLFEFNGSMIMEMETIHY